MTDALSKVTATLSFNALLEEMRVLQRALAMAREDPDVFDKMDNIDIPYDIAVQQIERALELAVSRVAGVGIASLLVSATDDNEPKQ